MVETESKYGLKGNDISITLSEYIDALGCRLAIIAVGMSYDCSF